MNSNPNPRRRYTDIHEIVHPDETPTMSPEMDAWKARQLEKQAIAVIPCPNCYGGHFRPCQWCGDTGRVGHIEKTQ